jgi:Domain of unknown function (DUF1772)
MKAQGAAKSRGLNEAATLIGAKLRLVTFSILEVVSLFFAGLVAGIEFVVRYGVQPALTALDDRAHLRARIALVRRLRVLVPSIMVPTVILGVAVLIVGGLSAGCVLRWAGVIALGVFVLVAAFGTVPINIRVMDWDPDAPPADWKAVVKRWQFIDVFRSSAAILAFVFFLIAAVQ